MTKPTQPFGCKLDFNRHPVEAGITVNATHEREKPTTTQSASTVCNGAIEVQKTDAKASATQLRDMEKSNSQVMRLTVYAFTASWIGGVF